MDPRSQNLRHMALGVKDAVIQNLKTLPNCT